MPSSLEEKTTYRQAGHDSPVDDPDAEFGGTEARKVLERKLLLKVDLRMSIMIFIYILNYVSFTFHHTWLPLIP